MLIHAADRPINPASALSRIASRRITSHHPAIPAIFTTHNIDPTVTHPPSPIRRPSFPSCRFNFRISNKPCFSHLIPLFPPRLSFCPSHVATLLLSLRFTLCCAIPRPTFPFQHPGQRPFHPLLAKSRIKRPPSPSQHRFSLFLFHNHPLKQI